MSDPGDVLNKEGRMARLEPGVPGGVINPGRDDDVAWLCQVALCGLLDQLQDVDGRRLSRYEVGEVILGRTVRQMTSLFRLGSDPIEPAELSDIEAHLHTWAAQNFDRTMQQPLRCAPDDPRRFPIVAFYARVSQQPRAASLHVPGTWFRALASAMSQGNARQPSPIQVIAAGHALVGTIELLDHIPKHTRGVALASLGARQKVFDRFDRAPSGAPPGTALDGLATSTVELLLQGGQLPGCLFGGEAASLAARLRLPAVLRRTERRIRAGGVGSRLWRVLTLMLQAERQLTSRLEGLALDDLMEQLGSTSVVNELDGHLLSLLNDPPADHGYPSRFLTIEAIQQRLRFHHGLARGIGSDSRLVRQTLGNSFPRTEETIARCGEILRSQIEDATLPGRDRAFATQVFLYDAVRPLASLGLPPARLSPVRFREVGAGILAHALTAGYQAYEDDNDRNRVRHPLHELYEAITRQGTRTGWRAQTGQRTFDLDLDREVVDDTVRRVRRFIAASIADADGSGAIPDALLSGRRSGGIYALRQDMPSSFGELLVTLLTSCDASARWRCADALGSGMLGRAAAPILATILAGRIDDWEVPLWIRDLAMFAVLHLRPVDDLGLLRQLVRSTYAGGSMSDDDPRIDLVCDACWSLGDLVMEKIANDPELGGDPHLHLAFLEIRDSLYRASLSPSLRIRRAAAYGVIAIEWLELKRSPSAIPGADPKMNPATPALVSERLGWNDDTGGGASHPIFDHGDLTIIALLSQAPALIEMLRRAKGVPARSGVVPRPYAEV